jgi:hypothetical protein
MDILFSVIYVLYKFVANFLIPRISQIRLVLAKRSLNQLQLI